MFLRKKSNNSGSVSVQIISKHRGKYKVEQTIGSSNNEQELLFEDNGVVVVMQSEIFDRDTLLKLADQASLALRKAQPATSSEGDATPKWTPAAPAKP